MKNNCMMPITLSYINYMIEIYNENNVWNNYNDNFHH